MPIPSTRANVIAIGGNNTTRAGNAAFEPRRRETVIASGNGAAATFVNSAAFEYGATTTRANEQGPRHEAQHPDDTGDHVGGELGGGDLQRTQIVTLRHRGHSWPPIMAAGSGLATTFRSTRRVGGNQNGAWHRSTCRSAVLLVQSASSTQQIGAINSQIGGINSQIGVINSQISSLSAGIH